MDGPGDAQVWMNGQVYDIHVKVSEQMQAYEHLEPYPKPCSEAEVDFEAVLRLPASDRDFHCAVCLAPCEAAKGCELACGHDFHRSCITPWLAKHASCPLCRHPCCKSGQAIVKLQDIEYAVACSQDESEAVDVDRVRKMRLLRFA